MASIVCASVPGIFPDSSGKLIRKNRMNGETRCEWVRPRDALCVCEWVRPRDTQRVSPFIGLFSQVRRCNRQYLFFFSVPSLAHFLFFSRRGGDAAGSFSVPAPLPTFRDREALFFLFSFYSLLPATFRDRIYRVRVCALVYVCFFPFSFCSLAHFQGSRDIFCVCVHACKFDFCFLRVGAKTPSDTRPFIGTKA